MADSKDEFLRKTIGKDLAENEAERVSEFLEKKFTNELSKSKLIEKDDVRRKRKPSKLAKIIVLVLVLIIIAGIITYFFFITSTFAFKPYMEKPSLQKPEDFGEAHIKYLFNELGGYKLHTSPVDGSSAQIELKFSDTGKIYTITAKRRKAIVAEGDAPSPDIRIITDTPTAMELFSSEDISEASISNYDAQKIGFGLLSSKQVLAIKGYQSVYEDITKSSLGILGFLSFTSELKATLYIIIVLLVAVFVIWYLIFK